MAVYSTGVKVLDETLGGGLPVGFTALVSGSPGAGMELLAKQFASGGKDTKNIVYVSTTERNEDVLATMKRLGWTQDLNIINVGTRYYENVLARKLEVSKYRYEGLTREDIDALIHGAESERTENFLSNLTYEVSRLEPPFRLVIDSLDFFLEQHQHTDVISALRMIKAHVQHSESVAFFTLQKDVYEKRTYSGIEGVVDCIMELDTWIEKAAFKRILVIKKLRNHPERTGAFHYTIGDQGIAIVKSV
ncbi:MAG: recombinase RecA [Thermoplasmata archaeon]|nr:MAG: recombinase RecA [Thermoplasmata archaeon]